MRQRHAEIAGAGIAGLTAAAALAQRGWSVRVHERHASLRSEGFGMTVHKNGLCVLNALRVYDELAAGGSRMRHSELRDAQGAVMSRSVYRGHGLRLSRYSLVAALARKAEAAGAKICFAAPAAAAMPEGELVLADGRRLKADLVIAADGVNSPLRDSLGLVRSRKFHKDGAQRLMIRRLEAELAAPDADSVIEWWSGGRRIVFGACGPGEIYIALSCRDADPAGKAVPLDRQAWAASFPGLGELFARMERDVDWARVLWVRFQTIKLKAWSAGRVAVLGDAAHAMPPNLGQGGGCALMNAMTLAVSLDGAADIEAALRQWEAAERPLTEHTQRWSLLYSRLATWPAPLRGLALEICKLPAIQGQYRRTANHVPRGTVAFGEPAGATQSAR